MTERFNNHRLKVVKQPCNCPLYFFNSMRDFHEAWLLRETLRSLKLSANWPRFF